MEPCAGLLQDNEIIEISVKTSLKTIPGHWGNHSPSRQGLYDAKACVVYNERYRLQVRHGAFSGMSNCSIARKTQGW